MSDRNGDEKELQMGFIEHLIELRDRLLRMVLVIALCFACLFPFAGEIYTYLSGPLTRHLPEGSSMIAIDVASPFLTPFKMVLMLSVVVSVPYLLYQLWAFVAPGLYKHEKRLASPLLVSSVILFYTGMAFAYYVVFPLVFGFFTSVAPEGVAVMTDINRYLDFVIMLFFAFGISFEVPVAVIILVAIGATTPDKLVAMRPYIVVGAFALGMLLTPPDVISQVLLAVPIWLLFEAGVIFARILVTAPRDAAARAEAAAAEAVANAGQAGPAPAPRPFEGALLSIEPEQVHEKSAASATADKYRPMTDAEMDAELDRIAQEETSSPDSGEQISPEKKRPSAED